MTHRLSVKSSRVPSNLLLLRKHLNIAIHWLKSSLYVLRNWDIRQRNSAKELGLIFPKFWVLQPNNLERPFWFCYYFYHRLQSLQHIDLHRLQHKDQFKEHLHFESKCSPIQAQFNKIGHIRLLKLCFHHNITLHSQSHFQKLDRCIWECKLF